MSAVSHPDWPGGARTIEIIVRVGMDQRGGWEVTVPGEQNRVVCETLMDARRQAQSSAGGRAYELMVQDAYHRLLEHERLGISCRYRA